MKRQQLLALFTLLTATILPLYGQMTYTTLTGFYDYQSNGPAVQHIRVNPSNGVIHAVYMIASDSLSVSSRCLMCWEEKQRW